MRISENRPILTPAHIAKALTIHPAGVHRLAKFISAPDFSPNAVFLACERQRRVGVQEREMYYHGRENQF